MSSWPFGKDPHRAGAAEHFHHLGHDPRVEVSGHRQRRRVVVARFGLLLILNELHQRLRRRVQLLLLAVLALALRLRGRQVLQLACPLPMPSTARLKQHPLVHQSGFCDIVLLVVLGDDGSGFSIGQGAQPVRAYRAGLAQSRWFLDEGRNSAASAAGGTTTVRLKNAFAGVVLIVLCWKRKHK